MADGVKDIHDRMLSGIDDAYDKTKGSFFYDSTAPVAIEAARLDEKADAILDKAFADTAAGQDLERVCSSVGIERKAATYATGIVRVAGVVGAVLPKGEQVASDTATFLFTEERVITEPSGVVEAPVACQTPGTAGNVPAGAIRYFPKTLGGLYTVENPQAFTNGYNAETDDSLRARYYIKVRTPATSGNVWHYLGWATEVTGVGNARVFPRKYGPNTVAVILIDSNMRAAAPGLLAEVADHIERERPIGADVTVESARELPVNLSLAIVTDPEQYDIGIIKNLIGEALKRYLAEIAFKETYVSYAKIGSLILDIEGVGDYTGLLVNSAAENIPIPDDSVAVPGGVTLE